MDNIDLCKAFARILNQSIEMEALKELLTSKGIFQEGELDKLIHEKKQHIAGDRDLLNKLAGELLT